MDEEKKNYNPAHAGICAQGKQEIMSVHMRPRQRIF